MNKESLIFKVLVVTCATASVGGTLTCLSCKDSPLPRDCQYTEKCGSHEVCYSSAYVTTAGAIRHDLGCRDVNKCSSIVAARSANNLLTCSECCNGTLCNSGLCGQTGIPQPSSVVRGPICYSCDQQLYPNSCHIIKECSRDEVCLLSRFKSQVGHDILYQSKCARPSECAGNQFQTIVGKRRSIAQSDTTNCDLKCCSSDLCNSDCLGQGVVSSTDAPNATQSTTFKTTTVQTTTTTNSTTNATLSSPQPTPAAATSPITVTTTHTTIAAPSSTTTKPTSATTKISSSPTTGITTKSSTIPPTTATQPTSTTSSTSPTTVTMTRPSTTPTTTTATKPTAAATTTTKVPASCKDVLSICDRYKPTYCNSLWGLQNCRRTCNLCNVPLDTHCIDQTICNNLSLASCNTSYGLNDCIRSCNRC